MDGGLTRAVSYFFPTADRKITASRAGITVKTQAQAAAETQHRHRKAKRTVWILTAVAVALYLGFILTATSGRLTLV